MMQWLDQLRSLAICLVFVSRFAPHPAMAAAPDLCGPLSQFVAAVKTGEVKTVEFHTSWGSNFNDDPELALSAKRCNHFAYDPAQAVCAYRMEHGATEFPGNNRKREVMCLPKKTSFADLMNIDGLLLSFKYGTGQPVSKVEVKFAPDEELGGMVLSITASGY